MQRTKFIPIARRELVPLLSDDPSTRKVLQTLHHVMQFDADGGIEEIRRAYAPFDPDPLMGEGRPGSPGVFLRLFQGVMEDANFRRMSDREIQGAFDQHSLFPLRAEVDMDEYDILRIYRRGISRRTERYRGWGTLWRWKKRELTIYDRLVLVVRLKDDALVGSQTERMDGMEPGRIYLKSYKGIPSQDIEMILPNTRLKLRRLDRVLVGAPLVAGVGTTLFNSIGVILAVLAGGVTALTLDNPYIRAFGGVLIVLAGYLWRTHSKIKTTRLQYLRTLSSGLYFRNLANNAAVIDQTLAFANNEEQKEAMLAYVLLQDGPKRTKQLDLESEAWLLHATGQPTDFDVHDGLESLRQYGLVERRLLKWHALAPEEAYRRLDARWDAAF